MVGKRSKYFRAGPERYVQYQYRCKNKEIEMGLTEEEAVRLYMSSCFYCNAEAKWDKPNGIDRIRPDGDYVKGNVVPCCVTCNFMKGTLDVERFLLQCQKVANYGRTPAEVFAYSSGGTTKVLTTKQRNAPM